jgi:hypothetical protein
MASTYSPNLRIELIGNGEQSNTWGTTTNTNLGTLIEQAISGLVSVDVTAGNVTLTSLNGASDQSRQMIIVATGTPGVTRTITAPAVNKVYIVYNNSNAALSFIASGGTGVSLSVGAKKLIYCDGTNFVEAINSVAITSGSINGTTIGATAASTGAFTTLSASSTVSGTGFSTYLASPPAIGGTTAAAGKFTTLEYTGTLTGSTGILNIGSGQVYKDASGNVGIGTSAPSSVLNVKSSVPIFRLETTGTVTTGGTAYNSIRDSTGSDVFINGFAGLANCYQFGTVFANGFMRFLTGNQVEALRIDSSGNVGIGTSSPTALRTRNLEVSSSGTNDSAAVIVGKRGTGIATVRLTGLDTTVGTDINFNFPNTGDLSFFDRASSLTRVLIDSSGNVGIGTTAPNNKLTVGTSNTTVGANCVASFSGANVIASNTSGMVVITPTDSIAANIGGSIGFAANGTVAGYPTGSIAGRRENATAGDYSSYMQFTTSSSGGSVQEKMRIASSGIVTMAAYGAGAATFSAAGVISSVSDETWKTKDGAPNNPDEMLQKLKPGYWYYNDEKAPIFGTDRQLGFYAQNVNAAIGPEAAPVPEEGKPWGYYDRSVLAVTVLSLQKALTTIESLTERLTALENK